MTQPGPDSDDDDLLPGLDEQAPAHADGPAKPAERAAKPKDHRHGHRQRARDRFLKVGGDALEDYELLELVLHILLPQRDTKELAKALLARFGSFSGVLGAPIPLLREVGGLGDTTITHIKVMQAAAQRYGRDRVMNKQPVLSSWSELIEYCHAQLAFEDKEHFRVLFLDKKNVLIADEVMQKGTVDHTPVYPREVIKRSLELGATALILVHNHPSGDPAPSSADVQMTRAIVDIARPLGITVHDHIVVGKSGNSSFKALRLI